MIIKTYMARPGSHLTNKDAQRVGAFFDKTFGDKSFTPEQVVEHARPKDSPIHDDFDWDVSVAAEKWNLHQARQLIGSVMLVEEREGERITSRAYHHVIERTLMGKSSVYISDHVVWQRDELSVQVIERAKREFLNWQRRYDNYAELREWALEELKKKVVAEAV